MAVLQSWRCSCGAKYETLEHQGVRSNLELDGDVDACACGSAEREMLIPVAKPIRLDTTHGYPRMHPVLGWVESMSHEDRLLAAKGMDRVVDGVVDDMIRDSEKATAYERNLEREAADYYDRLENDPEYRDARRLRDKNPAEFGWLPED